jgi:hypothetical protein
VSIPRRYWDSSAFLAWLLPEPEREEACRSVLKAAEEGEVQIVTSALTLTEVIKLKGKPELKRDQEVRITKFFQNEYIILRGLDRFIAQSAQHLIWEYPQLKPKDSIHVATAVRWKIPVLDTFDLADLLPLDGKLPLDSTPNSPTLRIGEPHMPRQLTLIDQKLPEEKEEE